MTAKATVAEPRVDAGRTVAIHEPLDTTLAKIARMLGLADGEGGRAARLLALVFSLSAALVLLKGAQSGIFLMAYPRTMIPWAFAASAVTLATASMASVPLAARLGPTRLASLTLGVSSALVLLLRVLLWLGPPHVPFALYVVVEAISGLLLIQVWTVVSEATNARSAKRLLPVAGIGASAAWTIGGLATPALVHRVGTASLLIIAPGLLLLALVLVTTIARFDLGHGRERGRKNVALLAEWRRGLDFVRRVPLMRIGVVLSVLALVTEQLMDFQMMAAAKERYGGPEACAAFFGTYYGATSAISMVILLGASGRLMAWLGASRALLVTPVVTVVTAGVAAFAPGFGPVVGLRASDRVLKQSMWSAAMEQTQTPLPILRRAQARALTRGVIAPLAYAVSAVALAFLPERVPLRWLALVTLAGSLVMALVIAGGVRGAYQSALRRAIDDRRLDLEAGSRVALDADACRALLSELRSNDVERSSLAVILLRTSHTPAAGMSLIAALKHTSPAVRAVAVEALAATRAKPAGSGIASLLLREPEPLVRHAAIRALRQLGTHTPAALEALEARVTDDDPKVAAAARVALIGARDPAGAASGAALLSMLEAQESDATIEALSALGEAAASEPAVLERLSVLVGRGGSLALRHEALAAIARVHAASLLPLVVSLLDDPVLASDAAARLSAWKEDRPGAVAAAIELAPPESARHVASAIFLAPRDGGQHLLVRLLSHADATVRDRASRAIAYLVGGGTRLPLARAFVEPILDREIASAYRLYAVLGGLANDDGTPDWEIDPAFSFLAGEIERKIVGVRQRMLRLLGLMGNERVVRAVEFGLRRSGPNVDVKVAELLELALPAPLAAKVVPLFDRLSLRERAGVARELGVLAEDALKDPLTAILTLGDAHVRGAALYTYGERFKERFPALYDAEAALLPLFERMTFLRSVPLFGELSGEDLRSVAEMVEEVELDAGHVIFRKGDPGDDFFLVVRGNVKVKDGSTELASLGEREFFGELAVLDRKPRSADTVTSEPTELLRLRAADLAELMARRPQILEEILLVVVRRLRALISIRDQ